ncbi:MAG TPA: NifB/NifX family molybdenum-iron cluster-binding protein [Polyangia bacterium]|jgi:predicted Fe-Mo cluster-binding NifX family protein
MNICIPVNADQGLDSPVCAHFGSAPLFMMVDFATGACRAIVNANQHHGHGMCQPLAALAGEQLDAMVVGGIGMGALNKLRAARVQVFLSGHATVAETLAALKAGTLREVTPATACAHHGHDAGHGQGRGPA